MIELSTGAAAAAAPPPVQMLVAHLRKFWGGNLTVYQQPEYAFRYSADVITVKQNEWFSLLENDTLLLRLSKKKLRRFLCYYLTPDVPDS